MENKIIAGMQDTGNREIVAAGSSDINSWEGLETAIPVYESLVAARAEPLSDYIMYLNLLVDSNTIILPADSHFYFNLDEWHDVKMIINLKILNREKKVNKIFAEIAGSLPAGGTLVGWFVDNIKNGNGSSKNPGNGDHSKNVNSLASHRIIDVDTVFTTNHNHNNSKYFVKLSSSIIEKHLSSAGFRIQDMTNINGTTCFYALKS